MTATSPPAVGENKQVINAFVPAATTLILVR
jgi:hypothetical protein